MAIVLGINGVFHDPAAALVVDGKIVAAAEEERFSRRKHGKEPVPFSTWELPVAAARWCLADAGVKASALDAVAYSYDPALAQRASVDVMAHEWEALRTLFVERVPWFLRTAFPDLPDDRLRYVPHHVAHAASAFLGAPFPSCAVMVLDGRGEQSSYLAGHVVDRRLRVLRRVGLPDSLGLLYEEATEHLGFRRSSDEYKVMALAAYGEPTHLPRFRELVRTTPDGGFVTSRIDWHAFASPRSTEGETWSSEHADLAATVQRRLEEIELQLAAWLSRETGERALAMAGGVALNCVANTHLWRNGPFDDVWVQPAAGDAGTALGAALCVAQRLGDEPEPMTTAALGRGFDEDELAATLRAAAVPFERPDSIGDAVAEVLAGDGVVAWFQGRSEWGPRALGNRSLLANPTRAENLQRLNDIKGREEFRPVAPMVRLEDAPVIFDGPFPSPYMLFTHTVRPEWRSRIPAVVHVDGTARVQTIDRDVDPRMTEVLDGFAQRTGVPVVVNTSLNTRGRPMVDAPADALECFGAAPIDALAIGPFLVRRARLFDAP